MKRPKLFNKRAFRQLVKVQYGDEKKFIQAYNQKFDTNIDATTFKNWSDPKAETRITVGQMKNLIDIFGIKAEELYYGFREFRITNEKALKGQTIQAMKNFVEFDGNIAKTIESLTKPFRQINAAFASTNKRLLEFSERLTASFKGLNLNQEQDSNFSELIEKDIKKNNNDINVDIVCIPKLSVTASAGGGNNLEAIDNFSVNGVFVGDNDTLRLSNTKNLKAIKIDGYSMLPMLLPDSWVIFNDDENFRGDGLYVLNWDNTLMVKIVQITPNGKVEIISANRDYKSYTVDLNDSQIVFKIIGKVIRSIL
ncbi:MAG: S24 family peptidase [Campylobacteraceae bacterium]|jgi:phage repressor protein C with HTH and peptisase S24 domain|nr:S24 family peptidase [Campylobacteraceae bacterium]